ncbi:hydrogenase maturation nickel metallochaperone HypA [Vibrio sp. S11_S32]|uniref:hydrogenase maturation nickel metallochaperone HypA n=1 Tax=Vibrio sp. S11_S32 TaxID=2720225 RepID=UPI001681875A|nr:hydrogenase maturation nickel metallochaperone HypA [Vibrio sp. S11_S32]MBD1577168.1 hydrogenase maturation nickel metallochaperone HypA [Vibrio sp. S11_S32]
MHEMSISMDTVNLVVESAEKQGFTKVTAVLLEIGALSCIEPETIEFCYEMAARGTIAEHSTLHIESAAGEAYCFVCEKDVVLEQRGNACPSCGGFQLKVMQGDELRVKEIEVE